jgi:hypothetical protein
MLVWQRLLAQMRSFGLPVPAVSALTAVAQMKAMMSNSFEITTMAIMPQVPALLDQTTIQTPSLIPGSVFVA